ncbi:MAG: glycosyltransferase family 4 protein [Flavobacteriales bacterium]|nr:glycosyltransferase family 4 protein [Flavobacteriales bacterium]
MVSRTIHVLHTFANNSEVPYLSWFAERAAHERNVRYSFIVLYAERPRMMDEMKRLGFPVIWIRYDDRARKRGMLRALPLLWWHMMRLRPDIVHCNLFDDTLPGVIAAWAAGIKARVITRQDTGFHWLHAPRWVSLDRWNNRMARRIIAISEENKRFIMDKEGAPEEKIDLVHNGIPPERFTGQQASTMAAMRERFGMQPDHIVFGTVARFIPWKGYRHIVGAAKRIVEHTPQARFLFCGQGEQEQEIRELIVAEGLSDHILLVGRIAPKEMASFYGLLDIYIHAATLEPFGLVYAEAMMNGVPVVSTPTGAAADAIIDGVNGILVRTADADAMAAGALRMLQGDRKAMGEAGRQTALRMYSFDTMWSGTMAVYEKARPAL